MDRTGQNETGLADTGHHQNPPSKRRSPHEGLVRIAVKVAAKTQGFIYFIACGEFVKIGHSATPRRRPKDFATANPYDCTIIGIMPGGTLDEAKLHERFAHLEHRNEWFHKTPELIQAIDGLCGDWSAVAPRVRGGASLVTRMLQKEKLEPGTVRNLVFRRD